MKQILITTYYLVALWGIGYSEVNLREPVRNNLLDSEGDKTTLEKVKIIGHPDSGRCLVLDNQKRQGENRETQFILWDCHNRQIKGLEQELYMLIKSNGGGYLVMGNAGSPDKCISAGQGYYDLIVSRKCDPLDENQSWIFRRTPGSNDKYQMVHMSTGRCVRTPGIHDGAWVRVGDCDLTDSQQMWQICGLNGTCDF